MVIARGVWLAAAVAALTAEAAFIPVVNAAPTKKREDADGKDDRAGVARWEWQVLDAKGKPDRTGTFTGYVDGSIKYGKPQEAIGSFKTTGKKTATATFTKGPLKGTVTMHLADRKPVTYRGELVRDDGTKADVVIEIIND